MKIKVKMNTEILILEVLRVILGTILLVIVGREWYRRWWVWLGKLSTPAAQATSITKLLKRGFRFANRTSSSHPDAEKESENDHSCVVMVKSGRFTHEFRGVEPDGSIH